MKYWESATICSITPTRFSHKAITLIKWTVIGVFTTTMLVFCIFSILSVKVFEIYFRLITTPVTLFALLVCLSTMVTIFAIRKIFETAKELTRCYNKAKINKKVLILHSVILIFYCASVVLYVIGFNYSDLGLFRSGSVFIT